MQPDDDPHQKEHGKKKKKAVLVAGEGRLFRGVTPNGTPLNPKGKGTEKIHEGGNVGVGSNLNYTNRWRGKEKGGLPWLTTTKTPE